MANAKFKLFSRRGLLYILAGLGIILGFALTVFQTLNLCTEACAAVHNYRLHGMKFEIIGMIFFPLLFIFHIFSRYNKAANLIAGLMLAGALGAEIMFVLAQKFIIGHWCPICLSIAGVVGFIALMYIIDYLFHLTTLNNEGNRREFMQKIWKAVTSGIVLILGFLFAFTGIAQSNPLQAEENSIKDSISFGNKKSPVEIYLFTDWVCPACRKAEPALVKMMPKILPQAKITFVDYAIHPSTLNFTPYNLSFMVRNKDKYLKLRDALTALSEETETPTDQRVEAIAKKEGVVYQQLNYADVALGIKYFKHLGKEFNIDSTPTLVLVNRTTKKGKKLHGPREITEENVMNALEMLKK